MTDTTTLLHEAARLIRLRGNHGNHEYDRQCNAWLAAVASVPEQAEQPAVAYTDARGQAGQAYHARFPHAHPLPAMWRWEELWNAMLAATPAAQPPSAQGKELAWLERNLFERKWDGIIGLPSSWHIRGDYRHTMAKLRGETLGEAIRALLSGAQGGGA